MRTLRSLIGLCSTIGFVILLAGPAGAAAPIARPDSAKTAMDTRIVIRVLKNDSPAKGDKVDPTSLNINTFPNNGDLEVTPNERLAYTPDPGFNGTDTFSYLVCSLSNGNDCATATVTVRVGTPSATTTTTTLPPPPVTAAQAAPASGLPRTGSASGVLALLGIAVCALGLALYGLASRLRPNAHEVSARG